MGIRIRTYTIWPVTLTFFPADLLSMVALILLQILYPSPDA